MNEDILYLGANMFRTSIPEAIYQLAHLTDLYLNDCGLTGTISESIGNLKSIRKCTSMLLDFFPLQTMLKCKFCFVRTLQRKESLGLHNNALTGTIPDQIGAIGTIST